MLEPFKISCRDAMVFSKVARVLLHSCLSVLSSCDFVSMQLLECFGWLQGVATQLGCSGGCLPQVDDILFFRYGSGPSLDSKWDILHSFYFPKGENLFDHSVK